MNEPSSRFWEPKPFVKEKVCYQFCSEIYGLKEKWALQIFREWQDQRAVEICTIEPGGLFKGGHWCGCARVD